MKKHILVKNVPSLIATITNAKYINSLNFNENEVAYLFPSKNENIRIEEGNILIDDKQVSSIKTLEEDKDLDKYNLCMLRMLYSIMLDNMDDIDVNCEYEVSINELFKEIGKRVREEELDGFTKNIAYLERLVGVFNGGRDSRDICPVLFANVDMEKNTLTFSSPYMSRLARKIHEDSIRRDEHGRPLTKKNGEPKMKPSYSYLIKSTIAKERNSKAIEMVFIIVGVIERCGSYDTPHISSNTLIERNKYLKNALESCGQSNRNILIERAFTKLWELLNTQTTLREIYQNIELPNLEALNFKTRWLPSYKKYGITFEFPHDGKSKKKKKRKEKTKEIDLEM